MTTDRFRGIAAKIERAEEHIRDLDRSWRHFEESAYEIVTNDEPETGDEVWRVHFDEELPDRFSAIIGDALTNLRGALDHLYVQLIDSNKKTVGRSDTFPIAYIEGMDERHNFESMMKRVEDKVSDAAAKLICKSEPYKGGNGDIFRRLAILNNADKHRLLITVVGSQRRFGLSTAGLSTEGFPEEIRREMLSMTHVTAFFLLAEPLCALKDGTEVFRIRSAARNDAFDNHKTFKIPFDIAFGQGEIIECEPVVPTLTQLANAVKTTCEAFRPLLIP